MVERAGTENRRSGEDARDGSGPARMVPAAIAAALLLASLLLPGVMLQGDRRPDVPGLGPEAWPGGVLYLLAFFSAIWLGMEVMTLMKGRLSTSLRAPHDEDVYHYGKAVSGIAMVIAYGCLWPIIGFSLATAIFLLLWCLYGGLRHPLVLILVPVAGTITLLWMFMGAALMPLSRGTGPFERFSVWLLQIIGIY